MSLPTVDVKPLDPYLYTGPSRIMSGPIRVKAVTPGTPYGEFATWLYVGATGNVNIQLWDGSTVILLGFLAGTWHNIGTIQVLSASTTATNIFWGS
jgi:hypothetical protein